MFPSLRALLLPRLSLLILLGGTQCVLLPSAAHSGLECQALCSVRCLKPLAVYDRWDDETPVPGYPSWQGNGRFDQEAFSDANANGVHDPGESFVDANSNGVFDSEFYDPHSTGYMAATDVGRVLHSVEIAMNGDTVATFWPLNFPPGPPSPPGADSYRWDLENCNPTLFAISDAIDLENGMATGPTLAALLNAITLDPGAVWNEGCDCVENSVFEEGPRVLVLPLADPRVMVTAGYRKVHVVKVGAFFVESVQGTGFSLRFCKSTHSEGEACVGELDAGFVRFCDGASDVVDSTWGRLKASRR